MMTHEESGARTLDARKFRIAIPHGGYYAFAGAEGGSLEIESLEGGQCCDLVCFRLGEHSDALNAHACIMRNGSIYLSTGDHLFGWAQTSMMTIIEDSVARGSHDILAGMCTQQSTQLKFGVSGAPCCRGNFIAGLSPYGISPHEIVSSFNIFMRVEVGTDGSVRIGECPARKGDRIRFRLDSDLIVALSVCPQRWGTTNQEIGGSVALTYADVPDPILFSDAEGPAPYAPRDA